MKEGKCPTTHLFSRQLWQPTVWLSGRSSRSGERLPRPVRGRHDALTGLPNRIAADVAVAAAVRCGKPACVALLDLDDFKTINDRHGHDAGDWVLKVVAERISALGEFQLVARLHGDEFLLLADGDLEGCVNAARAAAHTVAQEVHLNDGARVCPHSSIGTAPIQPGITAGQWCRNADTAMYQAKRTGTAVSAYRTDLSRSTRTVLGRVHTIGHGVPG